MAAGFGKLLLSFLFKASPVGMSGPAIDLRHVSVQTSHRRHLLQSTTVEIKGAGKLQLAESRLRHQCQPVCGLWRRFLQIVECTNGKRFVTASEAVPGRRAFRINISELP